MTVAVGFFDGVHRGHQAILRGASAALTFRNHPLTVLAPARAPRLIMSADERVAAIRACGVKEVRVLDFTTELARLSPEEFAARYLLSPDAAPVGIRCGADWRFGAGGGGDAEFLRRRGHAVEVVPAVIYDDAVISSSRIRAVLERGDVRSAQAMMGRRFAAAGVRMVGKGQGRTLGFPTVNLRLPSLALRLPSGVYAVEVSGASAVANYGRAPTWGDRSWREPVLEVHFLCGEDVRAAERDCMSVEFDEFLRPERTFASVEDLRQQIAADVDLVRRKRGLMV